MALRGEVVEMVLWHLHGHVDPALPVYPERGQRLAFVAGPLACNGPGRLAGHSGVAERLTLGGRGCAHAPGNRIAPSPHPRLDRGRPRAPSTAELRVGTECVSSGRSRGP